LSAAWGICSSTRFLPVANVILLSNVLHDWDVPQCRALLKRCAAALPCGGRVLVHDVFLNDDMDGPLPVALYSGALFYLTEAAPTAPPSTAPG